MHLIALLYVVSFLHKGAQFGGGQMEVSRGNMHPAGEMYLGLGLAACNDKKMQG